MAKDSKPRDLIGYDALQQDALRGVVRGALKHAAQKGLPGDHHILITFKTAAPGVSAPPELLAQYPDEMTIVLQHQYWDLAPGETFFSVTLRFNSQPKSLSIPYAAITQFWDPSVDYRLRFAVTEASLRRATPAISAPAAEPKPAAAASETPDVEKPNIVYLDQFRKK